MKLVKYCLLAGIVLAACIVQAGDSRQLNFELFDAAKAGDLTVAKQLLDQGASVSARNRFGNTAFIYAARHGHIALAKLLLERGSDINQQNVNQETALFGAVENEQVKMVDWLIGMGSDPGHLTLKKMTPIMVAAYNQNVELVKLLLSHEVPVDVVDDTGKSVLVYSAAQCNEDIFNLLLKRASNMNKRYQNDTTLLMWACSLRSCLLCAGIA